MALRCARREEREASISRYWQRFLYFLPSVDFGLRVRLDHQHRFGLRFHWRNKFGNREFVLECVN